MTRHAIEVEPGCVLDLPEEFSGREVGAYFAAQVVALMLSETDQGTEARAVLSGALIEVAAYGRGAVHPAESVWKAFAPIFVQIDRQPQLVRRTVAAYVAAFIAS